MWFSFSLLKYKKPSMKTTSKWEHVALKLVISSLDQSILNEFRGVRVIWGWCSPVALSLYDRALISVCRWHSVLCLQRCF